MSSARNLANLGSAETLTVDTANQRVGIGSTQPTKSLDIGSTGEFEVGTGLTVTKDGFKIGSETFLHSTGLAVRNVNATGVVTATSFSSSTGGISADSLSVTGISTLIRLAVTDEVVTGIITANGFAGNVTGAAATFTTGTFNGNVTIGGTLTYEDVTNVDSLGIVTAREGVNVSGGQLIVGTGITMGIAGVATFSGTSDVHLLDNVQLNVGDSSDLQVFHNGNANIYNQTGELRIRAGGDGTVRLMNAAGNEHCLIAEQNEAVTAYYDNSKKWETTNDGTVTTGIATATVGLSIPADSKNLEIGAGNDLQLYHNGTDSHIDNVTGALQLRVNTNEKAVVAVNNGAVELYYNNSKKFDTTNDGTVTTGIGTFTGAVVLSGDNDYIQFGAGGDFQQYHDGTNNIIRNIGTRLDIIVNSNETAAVFNPNGSVDLYHDNVKTFETIGAGITIYGPEGGAAQICLSSDEGDDNADKWRITKESGNNSFRIQNYTSGSWETNILATGDGAVEFYNDGSKKFETSSTGLKLNNITNTVLWPYDGNANSRSWGFQGENGSYGIFELTYSNGADTTLDEIAIRANANGSVDLYHDNGKRFGTNSEGISVYGPEGGNGVIYISGDEGDDNADKYRILVQDSGSFYIQNYAGGSWETNLKTVGGGDLKLYHNDSVKLATTNDGAVITGIATVSQGLNTDGLLSEKFNTTAGKLSANTNIDLENGMIHYFSTQETTTSTPNIRYSSSKTLNNMLTTGDAISVTVITTAAAAGYSANWQIDGNNVTEEWVGGSAPSEGGGSDGLDIYALTILKTGNDAYQVIANLTNATN